MNATGLYFTDKSTLAQVMAWCCHYLTIIRYNLRIHCKKSAFITQLAILCLMYVGMFSIVVVFIEDFSHYEPEHTQSETVV